jgi:hypothetical protein
MNELSLAVMQVLGGGAAYANDILDKAEIARIGLVAGIGAFFAACLWRMGRPEDPHKPRSGRRD